ncbi:phosphotransferase-like protein [Streptomyces niveus]|uniref:phosphotransferase-like protein n=1 Tax=Streptomyces niveus TaxID=193462 RepID=UPI00343550D5
MPRLIVLRGNSASGKSTIAAAIRERFGRGLALIGQDNLRRVVLRERDRPGAPNIGLIDMVARYSLDAGGNETIIGADSPPEATVDHVMRDTGLARLPAHE